MKASRFLLCLMASTACIPASGMSPAQTAIQNPDPVLAGPSPSSPFVTRQAPERSASATAPSPAMKRASKKTWLYVAAGAAALIVVILLVSGGGSNGSGY